MTALATLVEVVEQAARVTATAALDGTTTGTVAAFVETWRRVLRGVVDADPALRRTWHLVDLVATNLRGMAVDGLLSGRGYDRLDHLDYREWLARHGAAPETLDSPIVQMPNAGRGKALDTRVARLATEQEVPAPTKVPRLTE